MFEEKNVKHRANDASNDGHRPPLMVVQLVNPSANYAGTTGQLLVIGQPRVVQLISQSVLCGGTTGHWSTYSTHCAPLQILDYQMHQCNGQDCIPKQRKCI